MKAKSSVTRKDIIGWSLVIIIALSGFIWGAVKTWGANKVDTAIERAEIKHRLDSLCQDGIKKDIRDNTQDIAQKDFQQTVLEYIDKQDKRDARQSEDQRTMIRIMDKVCNEIGVAKDLIEDLEDRQEAKDVMSKIGSENLKPE